MIAHTNVTPTLHGASPTLRGALAMPTLRRALAVPTLALLLSVDADDVHSAQYVTISHGANDTEDVHGAQYVTTSHGANDTEDVHGAQYVTTSHDANDTDDVHGAQYVTNTYDADASLSTPADRASLGLEADPSSLTPCWKDEFTYQYHWPQSVPNRGIWKEFQKNLYVDTDMKEFYRKCLCTIISPCISDTHLGNSA
jgi:hypothetical protein